MKQTVALVLSVTALAVAVFGATPLGQAAVSMVLPANSVGTTQLKVAAVTGAKIKNGTLTAAKFKAGTLLAGPQGPKGDAGPTGAQGPAGPAGAGATHFTVRIAGGGNVAPGASSDATAQCQAGEQATGGGAWTSNKELVLNVSVPWAGAGGPSTNWRVQVANTGAVSTGQYTVYVICAS